MATSMCGMWLMARCSSATLGFLLSAPEGRRGRVRWGVGAKMNADDRSIAELLYRTTIALAAKSQASRDYAEALRYLGEAAQLRPEDPEPHRAKAEIYRLTGKTADAADEQQRSKE